MFPFPQLSHWLDYTNKFNQPYILSPLSEKGPKTKEKAQLDPLQPIFRITPDFDGYFFLQISNTSELSITYSLKLDSLSPLRHSRAQVLPRFLPPFSEMPETQQHALGEIDIVEATSYGFYCCCYLWCCEIFFFLVFVKKLMCCVDVLVEQLIYYRVKKMVHFEISKEVEKDEKDILLSCHKRRTKKKFWVAKRHRASDLRIWWEFL